MFPWWVQWAPQIHFPFSGSVAQRIAPSTDWFFGAIDADAGNGRIEQKAFDIASYGRQLGLLTEVLLDIAERQPPESAKGVESLVRLCAIKAQIDLLKRQSPADTLQRLINDLRDLREQHPDDYPRIREQLRSLLDE